MKRIGLIAGALACASLLSACSPQGSPEGALTKAHPKGPELGRVAPPPVADMAPKPMGAEAPVVKKLETRALPEAFKVEPGPQGASGAQ